MIRVERLSIRAGGFVLQDVSFAVPRGSYAVLMGRTGTGKTTLLEAIAGLKSVEGGAIFLDDRDVTRLKPAEREVGYVPQDGALFDTMVVRDHLAFALEIRREPMAAIEKRVGELAELLGITHLLPRRPKGLSGGERQRVALGRALSFGPRTLLLDEPLSALDEETRGQMYGVLRQVRAATGVTTLHVTHNREDADQLADVLLRIESGRVLRHAVEARS